MAIDPDTGIVEGDQLGRPVAGVDQNNYTHSDSGNSGNSTTTNGGPGTAGSVAQDTVPGAPDPPK